MNRVLLLGTVTMLGTVFSAERKSNWHSILADNSSACQKEHWNECLVPTRVVDCTVNF